MERVGVYGERVGESLVSAAHGHHRSGLDRCHGAVFPRRSERFSATSCDAAAHAHPQPRHTDADGHTGADSLPHTVRDRYVYSDADAHAYTDAHTDGRADRYTHARTD